MPFWDPVRAFRTAFSARLWDPYMAVPARKFYAAPLCGIRLPIASITLVRHMGAHKGFGEAMGLTCHEKSNSRHQLFVFPRKRKAHGI